MILPQVVFVADPGPEPVAVVVQLVPSALGVISPSFWQMLRNQWTFPGATWSKGRDHANRKA